MQDRKKIYSEQLLQIHTDSQKRNPGKEIYATGYVIELKLHNPCRTDTVFPKNTNTRSINQMLNSLHKS